MQDYMIRMASGFINTGLANPLTKPVHAYLVNFVTLKKLT